jgi:anti-sigma factor RsiW
MHCDAFLATVEPWLDGELPSEAAAASAAHARDCAHCAAALAARREERARLRALLDDAPPRDLRAAILAASRGRRLARRTVTWSAYEEPGAIRAGTLILSSGPRGLAAPLPSQPEGDAR